MIRKINLYEDYQSKQQMHFFNTIYHDENFRGRIFFGVRGNYDEVRIIEEVKLEELDIFLDNLKIYDDLNYYFTVNQFAVASDGCKRNNDHLFAINSIVVDLDYNNRESKDYSAIRKNCEIYKNLVELDACRNDGIKPYFFVYTGRGIQIHYIYEKAISYKLKFIHDAITNHIINIHEKLIGQHKELGLHLDYGPSKNAVGFFRVPYTYNRNISKRIKIQYGEFDNSDFIRHQEVIDKYKLLGRATKSNERTRIKATNTTSSPWCIKRSLKIINAIEEYQRDKIKVERVHQNRTRTMFVLSSFLLNVMNENEALSYLEIFNSRYDRPHNKNRLKTLIRYAIASKDSQYRNLTNKTILEMLELDSEDYGIVYTPNYQEEQRALKELRAKRKIEKKEKHNMVVCMLKENKDYATISKTTGLSKSTIKRIKREANIVCDNSSCDKNIKPWDELGISRATYYRRISETPGAKMH